MARLQPQAARRYSSPSHQEARAQRCQGDQGRVVPSSEITALHTSLQPDQVYARRRRRGLRGRTQLDRFAAFVSSLSLCSLVRSTTRDWRCGNMSGSTYVAIDGAEFEFLPRRAAKISLLVCSLTSFSAIVFLVRVSRFVSLQVPSKLTSSISARRAGRSLLERVSERRCRAVVLHWNGLDDLDGHLSRHYLCSVGPLPLALR